MHVPSVAPGSIEHAPPQQSPLRAHVSPIAAQNDATSHSRVDGLQ
jgi:hypothetical protein